ncbi:hypothetical protein F7734_23570 [Scytonema sp. UIC 10036]|uniref:PepSY domain-containing protein n=1 Tax=Scytonema sp. UIC 10036 TaxID=2304196 RepID=UPI0012DAF6D7|nr:PepSY-associated TM helix domain-containing protein [Scytonema sp. UIC 10036]MUG95173.1 hypothetical protein [Scytonema sp. UIC 10036]
MKSRKFRDIAFILHRYIGLAVGILIAFIGFTGSLLVFKPEIEQFLISRSSDRLRNFLHVSAFWIQCWFDMEY